MMSVKTLSSAELEIMELLWKEMRSLTAHEILALMPEKSWKTETLLTFLSRLQRKGAVSATKVPTAGRRAHSLFFAAVTRGEYCLKQNRELINKFYDGNALALVLSLLEDGLVDPSALKSALKDD